MTMVATRNDPRDTAEALASLGGLIASLIPGLILGYMLVIWPRAVGGTTKSPTEEVMGWLAPIPVGGESSRLKQVAYPFLFMLAVGSGLFTTAYRRIPYLHLGVAAMLFLLVLASISPLWSLAPKASLMRAFLLCILTATIILSVYAASSFQLMMRTIMAVMVLTALLNLHAVLTQPPGPIGHTGIYPHKNFFGWVAVVVLFFGLYFVTFGGLVQRLAALAMIVPVPLFLIAAESKTSLGLAALCPVVGLLLVYAARRMHLSAGLLVPVAIALAALVFFIGKGAGLWTFYSANEAILGDGTLTGRTDIWIFATDLISRRPILGYGYEAVWAMGYEGIAYMNTLGFPRVTPTGHNGYIDILLYMGVVGIAGLAVFIVAALATASQLARLDMRLGWLSLTFAVFVILHNNLESDIFVSSNGLSVLTILFFLIGLRLTGARRS